MPVRVSVPAATLRPPDPSMTPAKVPAAAVRCRPLPCRFTVAPLAPASDLMCSMPSSNRVPVSRMFTPLDAAMVLASLILFSSSVAVFSIVVAPS